MKFSCFSSNHRDGFGFPIRPPTPKTVRARNFLPLKRRPQFSPSPPAAVRAGNPHRKPHIPRLRLKNPLYNKRQRQMPGRSFLGNHRPHSRHPRFIRLLQRALLLEQAAHGLRVLEQTYDFLRGDLQLPR